MGRDEHTKGSNASSSLPQTPKKQKIRPGDMKEEIAKELAELRSDPKSSGATRGKSSRWP
ncbi:hypothetical protein HMPREF9372_1892 [Sporosarcina newyorkensis 2681]|uniref:Uncharacterized protein n=1 Tax=Sporosarcina newyorkensis 2681 TaxID=1027292 RepID=F9DSW1_9BACL|nr:hypothetical protein [Sporosarcina newyorkensis]EGQ26105.1 hypothetical protein HMPREF9372_1892 [Sporosarcina newyorkensis 2681]